MHKFVSSPVIRIFSIVSLAVCVMILLLWGRSYWVLDRLSYQVGDGLDYKIRSDTGRLSFFHTTAVHKKIPQLTVLTSEYQREATPPQMMYHSLPFEYEHVTFGDVDDGGFVRKKVGVPYWSLAVVTGVVPGWRVWWHRRKGSGNDQAPMTNK